MKVFEASELRRIQLRLIMERFGTKLLLTYVQCSCGEYTSKDIVDLCSIAQPKSIKNPNNLYIEMLIEKRKFVINLYPQDKEKANVILNSANPDNLNLFDITLLNKFLVMVDPNEKVNLKKIVGERNELFHSLKEIDEGEFNKLYDDQEKLLNSALQEVTAIGNRHLTSVIKQEKKDEIAKALAEISTLDISNEMKNLRVGKIDQILADAEEYLRIVGCDKLTKNYAHQIAFNPIFFLLGKKEQCHVLNLYTNPEFKSKDGKKNITLDDIFDLLENSSENLLIEAPSGAGKTTFCRMLLAKKSAGDQLKDAFIIPVDCRREDIESLDQVIGDIFPDAANDFGLDKFVRAVIVHKPLFFIDGLDEKNEKSRKVISQILSLVSKGQARFVATSRPGETVREFLNSLEQIPFDYIELTGILESHLEATVAKYYDLFSKDKNPTELKELIKSVRKKISSRGRPISPLIVCLITYLLVDKENGWQACRNITDLYESILQAMYRKLEKRLRDLKDYRFDSDDFDENLEIFYNNLCEFSLKSLSSNQTFYSLADININSNDKKFKIEALSAVFISKTQFTRHGISKKLEYSFPHRSFQEFLASKQVVRIIENDPDTKLIDIFGKKHLEDERMRFFLLGLLADSQILTQELADELVSYWRGRSVELTLLDIIREGFEASELVESISKIVRRLEIDADHDTYNLLLENECPKLKRVDLKINSRYSSTIMTMALLKDKDIEVSQVFKILQEDSQILLKEICHGKCKILEFEGRLGESGLKLLPKTMNELTLWIRTDEELEAIDWLAEATAHKNINSFSSTEDRLDIRRIVLIIEDECDVSSLPKRLPSASYKLDIRLPRKSYENFQRVFDIAEWLHKAERKFPYTRVWFIPPETGDFDQLLQLHEFVKIDELFPTSIYYHSSNDLQDKEGNSIPLSYDCFSASSVADLPEKIVQLNLELRKSEQIKELQVLRERLQGGNNRVKPMKVLKLVIEIFDSCEATDDLNMLEAFPTSSRHLVTRFKAVDEASYNNDIDINWINKFVKKLPKDEWCHINLGNYNLTFEFWKHFLQILSKESLKAVVWNKFKDIPEEELISLWHKLAGNTIILRKTPTLPMPM